MATIPAIESFTRGANDGAPRHLGTRYDKDGNFLPEPGNTVVSHVMADSGSERALVELRKRMMALPGAERLAFTPVSSLHMTVFQGIIEFRRKQPYWPADLPVETPIEAMTEHFLGRLADFEAGPPFRVRATGLTPLGVVVAGATDDDDQALAQWRDRLADCFGYRHPDHDGYVFHITLAYITDWLEDDTAAAWREGLADGLAELQAKAPVIELRPPAFCSFEDMRHFEALRVLA